MDFMKEYEFWSTDPYFDEGTRNELIAIKDDKKEIEDRFYRDLEFGTAGLRGVLGAGTNRMNVYTVAVYSFRGRRGSKERRCYLLRFKTFLSRIRTDHGSGPCC